MPWTSILPPLPAPLRAKIEAPVNELAAHFLVTMYAVVFIAITELVLHLLHLDVREVPLLKIPLSDWMFDMDILSVSIVLLFGLLKALREMW